MKWSTHRHLTSTVLKALGISGEFASLVVEACVYPDRVPDYRAIPTRRGVAWKRVPHHSKLARDVAWSRLRLARKLFLHGNLKASAHALGVALHYLQDSSMNPYSLKVTLATHLAPWFVSHRLFEKEHEELEEAVSEIARGITQRDVPPVYPSPLEEQPNFASAMHAVEMGLKPTSTGDIYVIPEQPEKHATRCPLTLKKQVAKEPMAKEPEKAVTTALYLTTSAIATVVSPVLSVPYGRIAMMKKGHTCLSMCAAAAVTALILFFAGVPHITANVADAAVVAAGGSVTGLAVTNRYLWPLEWSPTIPMTVKTVKLPTRARGVSVQSVHA